MNQRETGYSTLTVTALMLGLSTLAIAWQDMSYTTTRQADRLSHQVLADIHLEGSLYEALGNLINSRGVPEDQLQQLIFRSDVHEAHIRVSAMRRHVNVNTAEVEDISSTMETSGVPTAVQQEILESIRVRRNDGADTFLSLGDLGRSSAFNSYYPCLQKILTVYHDPVAPIHDNSAYRIGEGSLVHIDAISLNQRNRLEVIALLTGIPEDPYWIFEWTHTGDRADEACTPASL